MRNLKKRMIAATSAMLMLCPTTTCMAASENGSINDHFKWNGK